ncbi:MAG: DUF2505 domain-containing protein [Deltaproteobacteria bacterium]|nr:DUF2505 domain-containing protein [Deltaproteobacteria bacterium]
MREFTLVQDMVGTVDEYWRAFFDPAFEKAIVVALKFREYEILVHEDTATTIVRKTRAVPHLDAAAAVGKVFGAKFGYVEDGTFDKATRIWRARTIPDTFSQRLSCDMVMRVEPAGDACRRTLEFRLEAKVRGIGGLAESGFEKNLRAGWRDSAAFLNRWLTEHRAGA